MNGQVHHQLAGAGTYLWDGGTETVWAKGDDGALVQVEREIVPDITRILDETDPSVRGTSLQSCAVKLLRHCHLRFLTRLPM